MINGKRARERGGESGTGLLPYYLFCALCRTCFGREDVRKWCWFGLVWLFVFSKEMVWVCGVGVSCFLLLHVNCTCWLS